MPAVELVFRNNAAAIGWAFAFPTSALLILVMWVAWNQGGLSHSLSWLELGLLGVATTAVGVACIVSLVQPLVDVRVCGDAVTARERWLLHCRIERFSAGDLTVAAIVESRNGEGFPYFRCALTVPSGRVLTVAEGHDRAKVEAVRGRLEAALI